MAEADQKERVARGLERSSTLIAAMAAGETVDEVARAAQLCSAALGSDGKLLMFGNGGSAADATHMAAEFLGRFKLERMPAPAVSLSDNSSAVTAIGNDYGFEEVFARQVTALGQPEDVAIAFSTSGRSPNVISGLQAARDKGLKTIALVGLDSSAVAALCDVVISVPSVSTPQIQEAHIVLAHVICEVVEESLPPLS